MRDIVLVGAKRGQGSSGRLANVLETVDKSGNKISEWVQSRTPKHTLSKTNSYPGMPGRLDKFLVKLTQEEYDEKKSEGFEKIRNNTIRTNVGHLCLEEEKRQQSLKKAPEMAA